MNEYYTPPDDIVMFTKVKASQLNDLKDSVDIGFDNLPTDLSGLKQEVIDAREDRPTLLSRLQAAEASTAADVITCQAEVINCQAEVINCQAEVGEAVAQVALATIQANNAESSAQVALLAPGTSANSTTPITIGQGDKTFIIETGKLFVEGMTLKAYSSSSKFWLIGSVHSYNSGTGELILNVSTDFGVGTYSDWTISLSAPIPDVPGGYNLFSFNNYI